MTPLEQATAALDAFRAEREAYPRDCNHGRLARKCDACDADEEFLLREEWQARADEWRARALAAEAALERAVADADAQIVSVARDAEARGRQHGLLAAALQIEGDRLRCEDQARDLRDQNDHESAAIARLHDLRANGLRTAIHFISALATESA